MKNRRIFFIIIGIILIISIILVIMIFFHFKNKDKVIIEESINEAELEMQFDEKFNNPENEYVSTLYHVETSETGKYKINADIPYTKISDKVDGEINKQIHNIFAKKLLDVYNTSNSYTILTIDYAFSINNNIASLVVRCILKESSNPQRTIIKTYNYDIETNQEVQLLDIIPEEKKETIQSKIYETIESEIRKENTIIEQGYAQQGYNVYRRNKESDIYLLENATEFYLEDDILYIIYSYGNNNYTNEMDLIINKI